MLEAFIPVGIAAATGISVLMTRLHSRVFTLDRRLDGVELRIAEEFLTKAEYQIMLERMEAHMVRIENKLDKIIFK